MHEPPTAPAAMATTNKRRPKIDLTVLSGERKRGKSMFGIVLGTLNKAKIEDKERNASEAVCLFLFVPPPLHSRPAPQAKKRQLIEQRLQTKLRKETDSVRRAEEAKKDKTTANRKEEELQLKDSIVSGPYVFPLYYVFMHILVQASTCTTPLTEQLFVDIRYHPFLRLVSATVIQSTCIPFAFPSTTIVLPSGCSDTCTRGFSRTAKGRGALPGILLFGGRDSQILTRVIILFDRLVKQPRRNG